MDQLVGEYPTVTESEMRQALVETCSMDIGKAREIFRKKETEQRLAQMKGAAAQATRAPPSDIPRVEKAEPVLGYKLRVNI